MVADGQAEFDSAPGFRGSNQSGMRAFNERLVMSLLRRHTALPKAEIARMTGLSAQTASVIMRKLEDEGLLERCAPVRGKVGQPSVPMRIAPRGALFFGLKIGRRSSDIVLTDFLGSVLGRARRTYRYPDPDETLGFLRRSMDELTALLEPDERDRIAGLGIAMPGYLWEWAKQVGVPPEAMSSWRKRDIRAEIAEGCDFPVFLQNDASSACSAELVFGSQTLPSSFLYFYIGHFFGGGIALNNEIYTGSTGNAGALGPLPIPSAEGGLQQLVDVASLSCLEADLEASGMESSILWQGTDRWDVDPTILDRWLQRTAEGLAYAIASVSAVIDFEHVVIDGWLPQDVRGALLRRTVDTMPMMNWAGLVQPELLEGSVGPDARSLGAASLPLSRRFLVSQQGH